LYNHHHRCRQLGSHFDARISDLEQRMIDIELVRVADICDERNDCVVALKSAVGDL
jgi:hypothetical protein